MQRERVMMKRIKKAPHIYKAVCQNTLRHFFVFNQMDRQKATLSFS